MINSRDQLKKKLQKANTLLTFEKKLEILRKIKNKEIGKLEAANSYNVHPSTITRLLKNEERLVAQAAQVGKSVATKIRVRDGKFKEVDLQVYEWFKFMRANFSTTKLAISKHMIMFQAQRLAKRLGISKQQFSASSGWVDKWKGGFGFLNINLHGEGGDVDMAKVELEMNEIREKLKKLQVEVHFQYE